MFRYRCCEHGRTGSGAVQKIDSLLSQPVFMKHLLCGMHRVDAKDAAANKPGVVSALSTFIVMLSVVGKYNLQIWSWELS